MELIKQFRKVEIREKLKQSEWRKLSECDYCADKRNFEPKRKLISNINVKTIFMRSLSSENFIIFSLMNLLYLSSNGIMKFPELVSFCVTSFFVVCVF